MIMKLTDVTSQQMRFCIRRCKERFCKYSGDFLSDNKIAVCDPVYPVYVDSNVMAGQNRHFTIRKVRTWSDGDLHALYRRKQFLPGTAERDPDIIYLLLPRTTRPARAIHKEQLQVWVDLCQ